MVSMFYKSAECDGAEVDDTLSIDAPVKLLCHFQVCRFALSSGPQSISIL
jgi:hypothetical protein